VLEAEELGLVALIVTSGSVLALSFHDSALPVSITFVEPTSPASLY
jgi:hypothetical protein